MTFSFVVDRCPAVELLAHTVGVYVTFKENTGLFFRAAVPLYILTSNVYEGSSLSTSLPTSSVVSLFDYCHSNGSIVVSLWDLNVPFPND